MRLAIPVKGASDSEVSQLRRASLAPSDAASFTIFRVSPFDHILCRIILIHSPHLAGALGHIAFHLSVHMSLYSMNALVDCPFPCHGKVLLDVSHDFGLADP